MESIDNKKRITFDLFNLLFIFVSEVLSFGILESSCSHHACLSLSSYYIFGKLLQSMF